MPHVNKTARAEQDLDDIWLEIALDKPNAADQMLDAIDKSAHLLATQPLMGRARDELAEGLRSFPVRRYLVFYLPQGEGVELVRVLDTARDIEEIAASGGFLTS